MMFKTKRDVDKHVADILGKIVIEAERNLRGYSFARQYYLVKDYETAKRYLAAFLSVKEASAPGHKLFGQIYEQCGHLEKSVQSYKRSLELDDKQKDVVLKICELYCQLDVDPDRARYWAERAEKLFPHNDIVFRLRERLLSSDGEPNIKELEDLITNELLVRPGDINLRIKLIKLLLDTNRVTDAYDHAIQVEKLKPFSNSVAWYHCLVDVFQAYLDEHSQEYNTTLSKYWLMALDRLVQLCLDNTRELEKDNRKTSSFQSSIESSTTALQSLDLHLFKSCQLLNVPESRPWAAFLEHMKGQLFFHMATIALKRVKQGHANPKEASRMAAALLLAAYSFKPANQLPPWLVNASATDTAIYKSWHDESCFRLSQAGHVIIGMCHEDRSKWLGKVRQQVSTPQSVGRVYQLVFGAYEQRTLEDRSFFASCSLQDVMSQEFPDQKTLQDYDFIAQGLRSDSLHHVVWLALQQYNLKDKIQPTYNFAVFRGLKFSTAKPENPAPETLCVLDVEAFLYATVHCSALALDEAQSVAYFSPDVPTFFPASICDRLCTVEQHEWWHAAYNLFASTPSKHLGDLRRKLQHGIEVIRCIGVHGMDVNLIVHLAETFAFRASDLKTQIDDGAEHSSEVAHLDARACFYWRAALAFLERFEKNLPIRVPNESMFPGRNRELSTDEVSMLMENGRFYLACQAMDEGNHEAAIAVFELLRSPFASYYQSLSFKKLAGEEFGNKARESITSEMRSRHITLLTRARDTLYVTLDRIRGDKKHPLNQVLPYEIEDIETRLARIDPDTAQRHEYEAPSDDSLSTQDSEDPVVQNSSSLPQPHTPSRALANPVTPPSRSTVFLRTPFRLQALQNQEQLRNARGKLDIVPTSPYQTSEHLKPSPERLDSQIRSLASWQDTLINIVVEQNKALLETNNSIVEQLKQSKTVVEKLTVVLEDLHKRILPWSERRRRRFTRPGRQSATAGAAAAGANDGHQPRQSYFNNYDGQANTDDVDDDDDDEENFYDGYYYDEEDNGDARDHNNAAFQLNQAYVPEAPPLHNSYPYGQTTGLHGTSTITYTPPVAGRMMPPSRPGFPQPFYVAAPGSAQGNPPAVGPANPAQNYPPSSFYVPGGDAASASASAQGNQHPPTAAMMQAGVPPAYYHPCPATIFTGLPFSEGQKLPEFHFNVDPNSVPDDPAGVVRANPADPRQPPFAANVNGGADGCQTFGVVTPQSRASAAISAESSSNSSQLASGGSPGTPHAFQIALPPDAVLIPAPMNYPSSVGVSVCKPDSFLPSVSITLLSPSKASPRERRDTIDSNERSSYLEEDSSGPDFKPVIPLPAEVETKTGEEDESVLFEDRAKLFRYVDKEWKERGVGTLKILHNEASGRVRLLMRRDQILKTCANHSITPDMTLTTMKNQEKTWLWAAQDFADEKVRTEKFCARFKTADAWHLFNVKFELAKEIASRYKPEAATPTADLASGAASAAGFGDRFSAKAGSWNCPVCMINNAAERTECAACTSANPSGPSPSRANQEQSQKPAQFKFGFASPASTSAANDVATGNNSTKDQFKFAFASPQSVTTTTTTSAATCATSAATPPVFKFGFSTSTPVRDENRAGFVFGSVRPSVPLKPSGFVFGALPVNNNDDVLEASKAANSSATVQGQEQRPNESKFTLGGFSFKSAPVVKQVDNDEQVAAKKNSSPDIKKPAAVEVASSSAKVNPFAKFSFNLPASEPKDDSASPKVPAFASCSVTADDLSFMEQSKVHANAEAYLKDPNFKGFDGKDQPVFTSPGFAAEDFEPTAEFKPVVPLPELVAVKTGEEDEIGLFSERARLYRFVAETKEWKERGIGIIKLLEHALTGRVRVLMRRDQVFKICANHLLTTAMKLEQMTTSDRAWIWIAHDFSDGKLSQEKLAVKFKDTSMAAAFKLAFEAAQQRLSSKMANNDSTTGINDVPTEANEVACAKNDVSRPISEIFKPKEGSWICNTCYLSNDVINADRCAACQSARPNASNAKKNAQDSFKPLSELFKPKVGSWVCAVCAVRNNQELAACQACQTPNPQSTVPVSTFKFVKTTMALPASSEGTFKFGAAPAPVSGERSILKGMLSDCPSADADGFSFGSQAAFSFSFGGVRPKSPTKQPKSPVAVEPVDSSVEGAGEYDAEEEEESDNIYFHPVIPLPDKVDVKTGEEDEDVLYSQRAKLYRLSDGEWKERGVGDFKILLNAATAKIRLLMRREQILKLCCNHNLSVNMTFTKKDDRSYTWFAAADFSEGEVKPEHLAIRFKNADIAQEFRKAVDEAQQRLETGDTSTTTTKTPTKSLAVSPANFSFKPEDNHQLLASKSPTTGSPFTFGGGRFSSLSSTTSIFGTPSSASTSASKDNDDDDVSVVSVFKASPEQEARAAKLMLPAGFYLYEQRPPCPGCRGCEKCEEDLSVVWQKPLPSDHKVAQALALKLPANFFCYEDAPPCSGCRGCDVETSLNKSDAVRSKSVSFVETAPEIISNKFDQDEEDENEDEDEEPNMFSNSKILSGNASFANLAQQQQTTSSFLTQAPTDHNFAFSGAGATVFGGSAASAKDDGSDAEEDNDGGAANEETSTAHFEPVIPLPSLIEVVTGEEGEEKLFGERCKLYRWDAPLKQWKERGVGLMKVLKHKETGRFRLLMRRDQIHKVACNHALTGDIDFKPLGTSETSICWYATDFADETPQPEQFAARFKNAELMKTFCSTVSKCQQELPGRELDVSGSSESS